MSSNSVVSQIMNKIEASGLNFKGVNSDYRWFPEGMVNATLVKAEYGSVTFPSNNKTINRLKLFYAVADGEDSGKSFSSDWMNLDPTPAPADKPGAETARRITLERFKNNIEAVLGRRMSPEEEIDPNAAIEEFLNTIYNEQPLVSVKCSRRAGKDGRDYYTDKIIKRLDA